MSLLFVDQPGLEPGTSRLWGSKFHPIKLQYVNVLIISLEVGKYKIDGNKLYEMYSDEEEWIINDILLLNSMTLSVQELEADGVTPTGQKYSYQRVE